MLGDIQVSRTIKTSAELKRLMDECLPFEGIGVGVDPSTGDRQTVIVLNDKGNTRYTDFQRVIKDDGHVLVRHSTDFIYVNTENDLELLLYCEYVFKKPAALILRFCLPMLDLQLDALSLPAGINIGVTFDKEPIIGRDIASTVLFIPSPDAKEVATAMSLANMIVMLETDFRISAILAAMAV